MASVNINPTTAASASFWGAYNSGNVITAITDGLGSTFAYNIYPNTQASSLRVYSSAAPPSNFSGSTITAVSVFHNATSQGRNGCGTLTTKVWLNGNVTVAGTIDGNHGGAVGNYTYSVARPGGGSWTSADFFSSNLSWSLEGAGDAFDITRDVNLFEFYLIVTYTPPTGPTAAFTVSTTTGTAPLTVTFTDQGTQTPTSWFWQFGDTQTSALQNPTHVYTTDGVYTVTLTESNSGGSGTITSNNLITVNTAIASVAAAFVAVPVSGVQNLSVRFTDQSTGTPSPNAWFWQFGDGSTTTSQNPTHIYTTVGTYTVTLTASNATPTTSTATKTNYITVADGAPIPSFRVSTTTGERPLTVQFTAVATNAVVTAWFWEFGDGVVSSAQNPTHVYQTASTYSPLLRVVNGVGSHTTNTFVVNEETTARTQITVMYQSISATFTGLAIMGYVPLTVRFTDDSTGDAASWDWDFGDQHVGFGQNPVHTYTTFDPESFGVAVTVTDSPCTDPAILRHGLLNYWKMDEATGAGDRADFISTRALTPSASVTAVTGMYNTAAQLGTGVTMSDFFGFDWDSAWTIEGWFKFSSVGGNTLLFQTNGTYPISVKRDTTFLEMLAPNVAVQVGNTALAIDTFYHVAVTFDGGITYRIYLNGELEVISTSGYTSEATSLTVGPDSASNFIVDELARYSVEKNLSEIKALYNAADGLFFNPVAECSSASRDSMICPLQPDHTWGYFFEEMKYQMMEPMYAQTPCDGFDDFGGISKVVDFTYQRLTRFILETALLRKYAASAATSLGDETWQLPSDLIELLVAHNSDGAVIHPTDKYQQDRDTIGDVYILDGREIIVPGSNAYPNIPMTYSYLPPKPDVPDCSLCPGATPLWPNFPIPYTLWWIIRYGVMADLLSQAGNRNDPTRAGKFEELFANGIEMYKLLYRGFDGK